MKVDGDVYAQPLYFPNVDVPGKGKLTWKAVNKDVIHFAGDWSVGYGLTYVWSPDDRIVGCFLGKDDALKVWINDAVVYDLFQVD